MISGQVLLEARREKYSRIDFDECLVVEYRESEEKARAVYPR